MSDKIGLFGYLDMYFCFVLSCFVLSWVCVQAKCETARKSPRDDMREKTLRGTRLEDHSSLTILVFFHRRVNNNNEVFFLKKESMRSADASRNRSGSQTQIRDQAPLRLNLQYSSAERDI